jgi:cytochrome c oxidase cbb3-type subunit 3
MEDTILSYILLGFVIFTGLSVLIICLQMLQVLNFFIQKEAVQTQEALAPESLWTRINKRFISGNLPPVGQEQDIMLHHSYDGIHELDNGMPPWLKYLFYGTIAFAVIYLVNFFALGVVQTSDQEYVAEMAQAEKDIAEVRKLAAAGIDENNATLVSEATLLESAKAVYVQNCQACHGSAAEGGVGPNLTDEYWLHGGSVQAIFKTIKYGVPQKGMIAWQQKLKPDEIQNVASYILSLQGTNPANGKEPQGDKVVNNEAKPGIEAVSLK